MSVGAYLLVKAVLADVRAFVTVGENLLRQSEVASEFYLRVLQVLS